MNKRTAINRATFVRQFIYIGSEELKIPAVGHVHGECFMHRPLVATKQWMNPMPEFRWTGLRAESELCLQRIFKHRYFSSAKNCIVCSLDRKTLNRLALAK